MLRSGNEDAEDVGLGDDQEILAVDLHVGAAVLGNEDLVPGVHGKDDVVSILVFAAGSEGNDLRFLGLLLSGIGKNDDSAKLIAAR